MKTVTLPVAYMPLVDAAPLIVAQEMGFAEEEGLSLELIAAPSWSSVRDMLAFGRVDAAHLLSPVPIAMALGIGGVTTALSAVSVLSANGNVIGVSREVEASLRRIGYRFDFANASEAGAALAKPIGERLFATRVELVGAFQEREDEHAELLGSVKTRLHDEVLGMNLENFMVRHKRRAVETFQQEGSWTTLDLDARMTLVEEVAGLPSAYQDAALPAKQFDLLVLNAQLLLLNGDAGFENLQKRLINVASALEALSNVPLVAKQMPLILDMQTDEFWVDVTVEILEDIRRRLRGLVELIKPTERKIVITDFEDEIGDGAGIDLPNVGSGVDKGRFKMKVRRFIEDHRDHITLIKLRKAEPLTPQDLEELERFFVEQGIAAPEELEAIKAEQGLGRFLRSLTGLDRTAAKEAFSEFVAGGQQTSDQLEFLDRIIDALTETGFVDPKNFYESPYTDIDSQGIVGVFPREQAKQIIKIVQGLNQIHAA